MKNFAYSKLLHIDKFHQQYAIPLLLQAFLPSCASWYFKGSKRDTSTSKKCSICTRTSLRYLMKRLKMWWMSDAPRNPEWQVSPSAVNTTLDGSFHSSFKNNSPKIKVPWEHSCIPSIVKWHWALISRHDLIVDAYLWTQSRLLPSTKIQLYGCTTLQMESFLSYPDDPRVIPFALEPK